MKEGCAVWLVGRGSNKRGKPKLPTRKKIQQRSRGRSSFREGRKRVGVFPQVSRGKCEKDQALSMQKTETETKHKKKEE